jgi:hypothetical protein
MKHSHERPQKSRRVAEPVQVYLDPADRDRLERLAAQLDATKSDVLRRGLAALESQTRRSEPPEAVPAPPLPIYEGQGLQPGVDLDDTVGLLDLMDTGDAPR